MPALTVLQQMREQRAELQTRIEEEKAKGRADAIEQIKEITTAYALTPEDLGIKRKRNPRKQKTAPKLSQDGTASDAGRIISDSRFADPDLNWDSTDC